MKILNTDKLGLSEALKQIAAARSKTADVSEVVKGVLDDVKSMGDKALKLYTKRFDGFELNDLRVSKAEIKNAYARVDASFIDAVSFAKANIEKFHKANLSVKDSYTETVKGVELWREFRPIEKVGLYVPGGKAAYPSTVLMLAVPAKIVGAKEIVMCTPAFNGECNAAVLVAADICGVDDIFKLGGAQAIAAMAYGTATVPKVDKIFGPGNQYVSTAKMLVFGEVAIDMPAGPSELMIIADADANCSWVAADLLSQLEHGTDSQVVLLTDSFTFARDVRKEMLRQTQNLLRGGIILESLQKSFAVVCKNVCEMIELANGYAPEHLEVVSRFEERILNGINNVGSVFLGPYSSEPLGDYVTGANHTLPTSGYARMFAPLSLESFGKKIQVQRVSREGIAALRDAAEILAKAEGLDAHANAVGIRFVDAAKGRQNILPIPAPLGEGNRINPNIANIIAYKPPLNGRSNFKGLLLDFNERTSAPGPKVINALRDFLRESDLQLYPEYFDLDEKIARYVACRADQILLSNGSDQLIDIVFRTFSKTGSKVYVPRPSFAMFYQAAAINGCELINTYERADLIVICNPNNPTGEILSLDEIEAVLRAYPGATVFVDEAYYEFSRLTVSSLIDKYENLIVSRTFSKAFGLAALRIGYGVSSSNNIKQMLKVRGPYDVNTLAVLAAGAALDDVSYMSEYRDEVMDVAKPMLEKFFSENGIEFVPSAANFLYFKPNLPRVFEVLKANGVLTRQGEDAYLRVSIGTMSQTQQFIKIYKSNFLS